MYICNHFDSANIKPISCKNNIAELEICPDHKSKHFQWFYFGSVSYPGIKCKYKIINAGDSSYKEGWKNYCVAASYNRKNWFRIETEFDGDILSFSINPRHSVIYFAHYPLFTLENYTDLITRHQAHPNVRIDILGKTLNSRL